MHLGGQNVFYQQEREAEAVCMHCFVMSKPAILQVSVWTMPSFNCCVQLSPGASVHFRGLLGANKMALSVFINILFIFICYFLGGRSAGVH